MKRNWISGFFLLAVFASPSWARDPFTLTATNLTNPDTVTLGFANVEDAIDQIDPDNVAGFNYADTDEIFLQLDFRGLDSVLAFGADNPTGVPMRTIGVNDLRFVVTTAGIDEVFTGSTRDEAIEKLRDFLKENKTALRSLLTQLARRSPIDPLAGNPFSLMTQRMTGDFKDGFTHKVSQIWGCGTSAFNLNSDQPFMVAANGPLGDIFEDAQARANALRGQNELYLGTMLQATEAKMGSDSYKSNTVQLPFSYTVKFDANPGHKLRFELPISATDTEGAKTYSLGFGLAYTYPATDDWSLTPGISVGATGSEDLGAAGGVGAYSLTSAYTFRIAGVALSLGNSVGRYESLPIKIGDVSAEADVKNTVFTNGILISGPQSLIAKNLVMEYSFTDTRITGDDVYAEYYDEVGIAIGYIDTDYGSVDSFLKAGISYFKGDSDITGAKFNLGYRF